MLLCHTIHLLDLTVSSESVAAAAKHCLKLLLVTLHKFAENIKVKNKFTQLKFIQLKKNINQCLKISLKD